MISGELRSAKLAGGCVSTVARLAPAQCRAKVPLEDWVEQALSEAHDLSRHCWYVWLADVADALCNMHSVFSIDLSHLTAILTPLCHHADLCSQCELPLESTLDCECYNIPRCKQRMQSHAGYWYSHTIL